MEMFNHPKASGYQPANDPVAKLQEEFHHISDEVSRLGTGFRTLHKTIDSLAKVGNRMIFNWMVMTASARGFGAMSSVFPMDVRHWMASSSWGHGHGRGPFGGRRGGNPRGRSHAYFGEFVPPGGRDSGPPPDFGGGGASPTSKPKPGPHVGPGGADSFGHGPDLSPKQDPTEEPAKASALRDAYNKIHGKARHAAKIVQEALDLAQHTNPKQRAANHQAYTRIFGDGDKSIDANVVEPLRNLAKELRGRDGFQGVADEAERMADSLHLILKNVEESISEGIGQRKLGKLLSGNHEQVTLGDRDGEVYATHLGQVKDSIDTLFGRNPKIRSEFDQVDFRAQAAKTAGVTPAVVHAFDTETTGKTTDPNAVALSVGWGSSDGTRKQIFVRPPESYGWDVEHVKEAQKVHGITKDILDQKESSGELVNPADAFLTFLENNRNKVLEGFNIDFDKHFIEQLGVRAGLTPAEVQKGFKEYGISFKESGPELRHAFTPGNPASRLDDIRKAANFSTEDSHDAGADAQATAALVHAARTKVALAEAENKAGGLGAGPSQSLIQGSGPTIGRKAAETLIEEIHREFKLKATPVMDPGLPAKGSYGEHQFIPDPHGVRAGRHRYRVMDQTTPYVATHEAAHGVYAESDSQVQARMRKYGRLWRLTSPLKFIGGMFGGGSREKRDEEGYADMFATRRTGGVMNPLKSLILSIFGRDKSLGFTSTKADFRSAAKWGHGLIGSLPVGLGSLAVGGYHGAHLGSLLGLGMGSAIAGPIGGAAGYFGGGLLGMGLGAYTGDIAHGALTKLLGRAGKWAIDDSFGMTMPRRGDWEKRQEAENLAIRTGTYTGTSPVYANKNRYRNVWRMIPATEGISDGSMYIDHKASKKAGRIIGTNDPSRARMKRYTDAQNPVGVLEGRELIHKKGDLIHPGATWHDRLGQATAMPFLAGTAIAGGGIRAASPDVFDTVAGHAKLAMTKASGGFIGPGLSLASTFKDIGDWADRRSDTTKSTVGNVAVFGTIALGLGLAFSKIGKAVFGASVALDVFRSKVLSNVRGGGEAGRAGISRGFGSSNMVGAMGTTGALVGAIGGGYLGRQIAQAFGLKNPASQDAMMALGSVGGLAVGHMAATAIGRRGIKPFMRSRAFKIGGPATLGATLLGMSMSSEELGTDQGYQSQDWFTRANLGLMETMPNWTRRTLNPEAWFYNNDEVEARTIASLKSKGLSADIVKSKFMDPKYHGLVDSIYATQGDLSTSEGRSTVAMSGLVANKDKAPMSDDQAFKGWAIKADRIVTQHTLGGSSVNYDIERIDGLSLKDAESMVYRAKLLDLPEVKDYENRRKIVENVVGSMSKVDRGLLEGAAEKARYKRSDILDIFSDNRETKDHSSTVARSRVFAELDKEINKVKGIEASGKLLSPEAKKNQEIESKSKAVLAMAWATSVTPEMMGLEDVYRQVQMSVLKSPLEQEQESKNLELRTSYP